MNRSRRVPLSKQFTSGGVYDPGQHFHAQNIVQNVTPNFLANTREPNVKAYEQQMVPVVPMTEPAELLMATQQKDNNMLVNNEDNSNQQSGKVGKAMFKKIFLKRKKSSVRLKEKKLRQNKQLRKSITPKNALMALNEVKGVTISDFIITNGVNSGFTALVSVNNKQYEGRGISKVTAKTDACEKALRDYVIEKMRLHPRYTRNNNNNGQMGMELGTENGSTIAADTADVNGANHNDDNNNDDDNDVPMLNLASFALFKLFSSWENEGFEIPEMHPAHQNMSSNASNAGSDAGSMLKEPNKPTVRNELPADWQNIHPATLLCMMRPGLTYVETEPVGDKANVLQTVFITVDDIKFLGVGRSKKIARRNAAISACNQIFGTNFMET